MTRQAKFTMTVLAIGVLSLCSFSAQAGYDSPFTLGVGIHSGYFHAGSATNGEGHRAVYGLNLRLRIIRIIGVSMAYDLNSKQSVVSEVNLPYPMMQFAAHVYFLQVGRVSLNLLVGLGLNLGDQNNGSVLSSYILGTELAIRVHNHVEVNAGLRFYLRSFEQVLRQRAGGSIQTDGTIQINADKLPDRKSVV